MNVALCFFGQPRFVENLNSFNSLKEHLYTQANVDVYTHIWFDENVEEFILSDYSRYQAREPKFNKQAIEIIKKLYSPVSFKIDKQIDFTLSDNNYQILKNKAWYSQRNVFNLQSHLYSVEQCINLFQEYSSAKNKTYDFVVITRYDIKVQLFPNLQTLEKEKYYITDAFGSNGGFNDTLNITDPKYLNGLKAYQNFDNISKITNGCVSEEYKQINFLKQFNKDVVVYLPSLRHSLLRSSTDERGC